jgi:hypothetical protein
MKFIQNFSQKPEGKRLWRHRHDQILAPHEGFCSTKSVKVLSLTSWHIKDLHLYTEWEEQLLLWRSHTGMIYK